MHVHTMTLEALRENKTLQTIYLSNNKIGPEGAKELAEANEQIIICLPAYLFIVCEIINSILIVNCVLWIMLTW